MQPTDVISAISGPTGDIGAAFYFDPATLEVGKQLGLDGFRFYVLGRGGVLGDVEPDVVLSAFGYFEPGLVAKMWRSACEVMPPREAARAYLGCMASFGRARFADVDGLPAYCDAAQQVIAATDPGAMPLFAGVRAEPLPDDPPARAAHLAMVLREMRGSAHLIAVRAAGLPTVVAHAIKRPGDVQMFGWPEVPEVTDLDRERHATAEQLTDEILAPSFAVLDDDQAQALVSATLAMRAALSG